MATSPALALDRGTLRIRLDLDLGAVIAAAFFVLVTMGEIILITRTGGDIPLEQLLYIA